MVTRVGRLAIEPILDGTLLSDPAGLVPGTTPLDWERHADLLTSDGRLEVSIGGFLVRGHDDRVVVIDTGYGADNAQCGQLNASLRAAGVDPADVTDVVLTHLHKDHIGGVVQHGEVTFPNATYRCHAADWAYFAGPDVPEMVAPPVEKLAALIGRLEPWDSDDTILPGLDVVEAPGHTPGNTVVVLSAGTERVMLLGDVVHCAAQLLEADWATILDVDPELATKTRRALIRELEEDVNTAAAGGHFPGLQFGRILRGQGTKRFVFDGAST